MSEERIDPGADIDPGAVTITIGPRRFDVLTAAAFALGLIVTVVVAFRAGLPGVIGTVYVLTALAAWAQGFRRTWRVGADQLEVRRWFRWRTVERADVSAIEAARDEMGIRGVTITGGGTGTGATLEIDVDDVRLEPLLAEALARFVDDCGTAGATVDPAVPTIVRP